MVLARCIQLIVALEDSCLQLIAAGTYNLNFSPRSAHHLSVSPFSLAMKKQKNMI